MNVGEKSTNDSSSFIYNKIKTELTWLLHFSSVSYCNQIEEVQKKVLCFISLKLNILRLPHPGFKYILKY